jgi:hypothetical protein
LVDLIIIQRTRALFEPLFLFVKNSSGYITTKLRTGTGRGLGSFQATIVFRSSFLL